MVQGPLNYEEYLKEGGLGAGYWLLAISPNDSFKSPNGSSDLPSGSFNSPDGSFSSPNGSGQLL